MTPGRPANRVKALWLEEAAEYHEIQRCMAASNPSTGWDCLVMDADVETITVELLNGALLELRVVGPAVSVAVWEPVPHRSVAEPLDAATVVTTARVA